jgi:hypothetical protein
MKRTPFLTAVAVIATLFFASCKNSGSSDLHIPKDAAMVFYMNTSSLTSKLSWKEIKETGWFKEAYEKEDDSVTKKILDNPEASGVDMKSDFAFFMKKQGNGGYMAAEGKIKNASDFEAIVKQNNSGEKVEKSGSLNYVKTGKGIVSWNNSSFIILNDAPMFSQLNPLAGGSYQEEDNSFGTDSLVKFATELLDLKSSNSINDDDRFADMLKTSGDLYFWVNSESYMSSLGGGMMSMFKFGDIFKGNASAVTFSFDDGKISSKAKQYYGAAMQKLMENYKPKNVDAALINRIPSQDVIGAIAFNFDPVWLKEFIKAMGFDGMVNGYLGKIDYSLDELVNALGGEFLFSVSDLTITKKEVTYPPFYEGGQPYTDTQTKPDFNILVASSVKNKTSFEKLLDIARNNMMGKDTSVAYKLSDSWFAAGNKAETVDKFLAGGNNKVPFADRMSGHPAGMFVDLQKIFKATFNGGMMDSTSFDLASKTWQDVLATGGEYKNGIATFDFVINMVDTKTNSLKQLSQFADKMYASQKARRQKMEEDVKLDNYPPDSVSVPPMEPQPK